MYNMYKDKSLKYHKKNPKGKIKVSITKPINKKKHLSLAYSPGVAEPCKIISKNKNKVFDYTSKGNLIGIISNGTSVLGLGNIGAEASKPVMEGKSMIFKKFAGIDAFDIEINEKNPHSFIKIVKSLEPTFGGINLEDIKSPECFRIEKTLKKEMNIPVMHDDQHGTAIVTSAALMNSLKIINKKIENIKLVVSGAGAAAISCIETYIELGLKKKNIIVFDRNGIINENRKNLSKIKLKFVTKKNKIKNITEAIKNSDMFLGLSTGNVLKREHIKSMARDPIVFALANPNPEISYYDAINSRDDIIFATGRSDYPNQINNAMVFPYIFRGALDVRAKKINKEMKIAAIKSLYKLSSKNNKKNIDFNKKNIVPDIMNKELITTISPAVAKAAIESGVSQKKIKN